MKIIMMKNFGVEKLKEAVERLTFEPKKFFPPKYLFF